MFKEMSRGLSARNPVFVQHLLQGCRISWAHERDVNETVYTNSEDLQSEWTH